MSATPQKPGWVNVPGKGRRYWTGSEYRFYGPSDNPASKGQSAVSGDIAGMWNNFVNQWGRSTSNPTQVGAQRMTPAEIEAKKAEIEARKAELSKGAGGGSKDSKVGVPPQAAVDSNGSNGARGENRSGVTPVNGSYRTAVEQAQSASKPEPQKPQKPGERVNANGLVSYGKDLSSLNAFTKAFTGGELTDIKSAFQSEDLPTAYQTGSNTISTEKTPYELPEGAAPSPLNEGLAGASDLKISDSGYTIGEASVPGTVGRSGDAQEGSSDKPDVAEGVRTIRMHRNKRDQLEGFSTDEPFGGVSETKGNGMNAKRRAIRSAFLDMDTPIIQASVNANRIAGYGKDSNGRARFNYGGELVYAKEGMQQKAKNAAMMGQDPTQFLAIGADTPTETQLQSGLTPGSVTAPENTGGSLETPAPITKASPEKFKETQDFLSQNISMLTRKTK